MARRRLYVPITRSGSSILASIFTQILNESLGEKFRNDPYPGITFWVLVFLVCFGAFLFLLTFALIGNYLQYGAFVPH